MARELFCVMGIALIVLISTGCVASDAAQDADRPVDETVSSPAPDVVPDADRPADETASSPAPDIVPESDTPVVPSLTATVEEMEAQEEIIPLAKTEALVKVDLATTLDVAVEKIQTVETATRTWPDQGLGCVARKGFFRAEPVPGYRIILVYGDRTFRYHTDRRGRFVRCPDPGKPIGPIR